MYLKQIVNGGIAGIAEWRRMWNQDVLPYLRGARLIAGRGVRINRLPTGTVVEVVDAGGHAAAAGGGAGVKIGAVVTSPSGGFGAGTAQAITINSDGTYSLTSGGEVMGYINLYL